MWFNFQDLVGIRYEDNVWKIAQQQPKTDNLI